MITIAWYLLKVIICSGILCSYYFLALRNKAFHRWNRFYLLAAIVISLLAPVIKISVFQNNGDEGSVIQVLQTISYGEETVIEYSRNSGFRLNTQNITEGAYGMISTIFLFILFASLYRIVRLKKRYPETKIEGISFIATNAKGTPFSFFNSIFWNNAIDLHSRPGQQIFNHEIAHVKEKHSYDKIFMNVVLVFFWINPFFWLMRQELYMIHEFVADQKAMKDSDVNSFAEMVLQTVYPGQNFSITNNFFYSPLKRRLLMLTKNKNPKASYLSRLLVLPLGAIVFFAFTLKVKTASEAIPYDGKTITVVIDAGHGGFDHGALSANGLLEKDITLAIAKKIAALNSNEQIKILLSRDNDESVLLKDRVRFAKEKNADLFISVHVNAVDENTETINEPSIKKGFSVLVDKNESQKNLLIASSLIEELKKSYSTADKIVNRENRIWVLDENTCPAALIECGYLTDPNDEAFISSNANQEKIAKNVLDAIARYAINSKNTDSKNVATISNAEANTSMDTIPEMYYQNKKVTQLTIQSKSNKIKVTDPVIKVTYDDGSTEMISKNESDRRGFIIPPPAPPAPPPPPTPVSPSAPASPPAPPAPPAPPSSAHVNELTTAFPQNAIYKVDGNIVSVEEVKGINQNNIESISILKEESAVKKYGGKEKYALIQITQKQNGSTGKDTVPVTKPAPGTKVQLPGPDKIFTKVEEEASFPGGRDAWVKYFSGKIKASIDSFTEADFGTCILRFIVNTDGTVSDIHATTMQGTQFAKAAINAIKTGPHWIPATQNDHFVASYRLQPVTLTNPDKKVLLQPNKGVPEATLEGSAGGSIQLSKIEDAKELKTNSDRYSVEGFTVYFSGANFPHVKSYNQNGAKFSDDIQKEWKNIKPGTSVTFDKVKIKDKNGNTTNIQKAPYFIVR